MSYALDDRAVASLHALDADGLLKREREITGPQAGRITAGGRPMLNLCSNNYLGLANHPDIIAAAQAALLADGFGMASVRFICGTQTIHRRLERRIADYLGRADAILFAACFDANGGLFEALLDEQDAIVSDALNHASIIDGIRLSRARRFRFANGDMDDLAKALAAAREGGARTILIATDGVFSMDGYVANLAAICDLAERYDALVMVDDCHAAGHLGEAGRGTPALTGVGDRVHIVTGTFGKTLGGSIGGFIASSQPVIDLLRQKARPYLFSNSLPPSIAAGTLAAIDLAEKADDLRLRMQRNALRLRDGLQKAGFTLLPGQTPIIPVMLGDARMAQDLARALDARGVYVTAFHYPVVPIGKARIRTQVSAAHDDSDMDFAVDAFADAGRALHLI
jgi:glycine C-acetyltransferase